MLLTFTISVLAIVIAVVVYVDASDNAVYPFVWAILMLVAWPLFLPVYIFFRFYTSRGMSARRLQQLNQERIDPARFRFPSEIEKAKFIQAAVEGPGTMFEPLLGENVSAQGFAHFTVERAELLLREQCYDEAWEYLTELYGIARLNSDPRALDTYRHYILRIPGVQQRFRDWLEEQDRPVDAPARKPKREAPF